MRSKQSRGVWQRSVLASSALQSPTHISRFCFPPQMCRTPLEAELAEAQRKLNYVMYFPRGIKYISVLKGEDEMATDATGKRGA